MKPWITALIVIAAVLLFLLIVFFLIGEYAFRQFLSHKAMDKMQQGHIDQKNNPYAEMVDMDFLDNYPHEEMTITTYDGTKLVGYLYKAKQESHRYIIGVHGWGSSHMEQTKLHHRLLNEYHANILLVCQRGHEASGGKYCTMSEKERYDIKTWAEHMLLLDKQAEIILYGSSFGAASVLSAASLLGQRIKGVIADSSYLSGYQQFGDSTKAVAKAFGPLLLWAINADGIIFHHIHLKKADVIGIMKDIKCPICLIHAAEDTMIRPSCLDTLFEAISKDTVKEKHLFPKGNHCLAGQVDPEGYAKVVEVFIEKSTGWQKE